MIRETIHALLACVVTFVVCAVAYPAAVWGAGQLFFPDKAEGSLVYGPKGEVIGSELIAQPFASETYFQPRPSAVDYKADAAGGSNLGTKNPDLHAKVKERAEALKATAENPAPADLVSASGSGLDPDISPEAANYQASRVAAARKLSIKQVRALIDRLTDRSGELIGAPPRINVLKLNLALDAEKPAPEVEETAALKAQAGEITSRIERLREQLAKQTEAVAKDDAARARVQAEIDRFQNQLKGLEGRFEGIAGASGEVSQLTERVGKLDARLQAVNERLTALRSELQGTRAVLKGNAPGRLPTSRVP